MGKEVRSRYPLQLLEWELTGSEGNEILTTAEIRKRPGEYRSFYETGNRLDGKRLPQAHRYLRNNCIGSVSWI